MKTAIKLLKVFLAKDGIKVKNIVICVNDIPVLASSKNRYLVGLCSKAGMYYKNYYIIRRKNKVLIFETTPKYFTRLSGLIKKSSHSIWPLIDLFEENYYNKKILGIIQKIKTTQDVNRIFDDILNAICRLIRVSLGAVAVYDKATNTIGAMEPGYNVSPEEIKFFRFELVKKSAAYQALRKRTTYYTNNAIDDPYFIKKFVEHYNAQKIACTPLFADGELFGFIYLVRKDTLPPFSKGEIETLDYIAEHIGWLLKTIKAADDLKKHTRALLNLESASRAITSSIELTDIFNLIVRVCQELLDADGASLMTLDKERNGYSIRSAVGISKNYIMKQFLKRQDYLSYLRKYGSGVSILKKPAEECIGDRNLIIKEKIAAITSVPLIREKEVIGIINIYFRKPKHFTAEDNEILKLFALESVIAIHNAELYQGVVKTTQDIIKMLGQLEAEKDIYTTNHSDDVAKLAVEIGRRLNLSVSELEKIKIAGILHDIGKIALDRCLLQKKEKLTDNDWEELRRHPIIGKRIIEQVNSLKEVDTYVYYHHERFDGKGYPLGLQGEKIPLGARILAIADAVAAMLSDRPYRQAMSLQEVIQELLKEKGRQFDPKLVDITIAILKSQNIF
ncbi:MAG: HD domain-containing phosphohydrolase [candidate division WOR-3 bacterium]